MSEARSTATSHRELHDRLGSMIDQIGQPDYSLRELVNGLREIRDDLLRMQSAVQASDRDAILEECAQQCDKAAERIIEKRGRSEGAAYCADLIRALKGKPASTVMATELDPGAQQKHAWLATCNLLDQIAPEWHQGEEGQSGEQKMLAFLRRRISSSIAASSEVAYLMDRLRCVPRDLTGGASGKYPIGELVHEALAALDKSESDKNWLRAQRDVAEEKLKSPQSATKASYPRRCTCYVLPHADDCEIFVGLTKSGERVEERRSGSDRRSAFTCRCAGDESLLCQTWCGDRQCLK